MNDFSILDRFQFDRPPVCIKYSYRHPEHLDRLDEMTTLCVMLKRAQEGHAFYADRNNITCRGAIVGMGEHSPVSLSGEVNYGMTGLSHGMGRRRLFPDGLQFVSIPYLAMPSMLQALHDMEWDLPSFKPDGEDFFNRTRNRLEKELKLEIRKDS